MPFLNMDLIQVLVTNLPLFHLEVSQTDKHIALKSGVGSEDFMSGAMALTDEVHETGPATEVKVEGSKARNQM